MFINFEVPHWILSSFILPEFISGICLFAVFQELPALFLHISSLCLMDLPCVQRSSFTLIWYVSLPSSTWPPWQKHSGNSQIKPARPSEIRGPAVQTDLCLSSFLQSKPKSRLNLKMSCLFYFLSEFFVICWCRLLATTGGGSSKASGAREARDPSPSGAQAPQHSSDHLRWKQGKLFLTHTLNFLSLGKWWSRILCRTASKREPPRFPVKLSADNHGDHSRAAKCT